MDSTDNVYIRIHDFKLLTYIFLSFLSERIVSGERDKDHIDFSLINYKLVSMFQASEVMLPKINS